jgi:hypothetical protein
MSNLIFVAYRNLTLEEIAWPYYEAQEFIGKITMNGKTNRAELLAQIKDWRDKGYKVGCDIEE